MSRRRPTCWCQQSTRSYLVFDDDTDNSDIGAWLSRDTRHKNRRRQWNKELLEVSTNRVEKLACKIYLASFPDRPCCAEADTEVKFCVGKIVFPQTQANPFVE
jgi:hypothetical protein